MELNRYIFTLLCLIFIANANAQPYVLMQVYDGDTVKLRDINGEFKLRLTDIDAPERNQAYGKKSRRVLTNLCKGQHVLVTAQITGMDKYHRYLGKLQCNQIDASLYLAQQGFAWHNIKYSNDILIYNAALQARQLKLGLWQDSNPTPPWVWRHQHSRY